MQEEDLHDVDDSRVAGEQEFFACPVCRKAQVLDLNSLQVGASTSGKRLGQALLLLCMSKSDSTACLAVIMLVHV